MAEFPSAHGAVASALVLSEGARRPGRSRPPHLPGHLERIGLAEVTDRGRIEGK